MRQRPCGRLCNKGFYAQKGISSALFHSPDCVEVMQGRWGATDMGVITIREGGDMQTHVGVRVADPGWAEGDGEVGAGLPDIRRKLRKRLGMAGALAAVGGGDPASETGPWLMRGVQLRRRLRRGRRRWPPTSSAIGGCMCRGAVLCRANEFSEEWCWDGYGKYDSPGVATPLLLHRN